MTESELKNILELHGKWIRNEPNGTWADLSWADLREADLIGANLSGADLRRADLRRADLREADLSGADLRRADLREADLRRADLRGANLSGASLRRADGINKNLCTPIAILAEQPGPIHAYKLTNAEGYGPYNGGVKYKVGIVLTEDKCVMNDTQDCAAGINLATLDWCLREWKSGYRIFLVEAPQKFRRKPNICIPIASDGKFRVRRCKVIRELDVKQLVPEWFKKEEK